jgi:hypothetical protein
MESSSKALTLRQQRFVCEYVKSGGTSAAAAARRAGYGDAYADGAAKFLLTQPGIKSAIEAARSDLVKTTGYDVQQCVSEIDAFIAEVRADKQPNRVSIVKALELKARLHGLLIERVRFEETVDVRGAILEARQRGGMVQDVEYVMIERPALTVDPFS